MHLTFYSPLILTFSALFFTFGSLSLSVSLTFLNSLLKSEKLNGEVNLTSVGITLLSQRQDRIRAGAGKVI